MKKTLILSLLCTFNFALTPASAYHPYSLSKMKIEAPEIDFIGGVSLPVTKTCLEDGHVRAKKEFQPRHTPLVRPILQVVKYHLGYERTFNLVHRVPTRAQLVQTFDMSHPEGRLVNQQFYDIPACEEKLISTHHDLYIDRTPSPQEMIILSSLFQRGITHAETQKYLVQRHYFERMNHTYNNVTSDMESRKLEFKLNSHQCQDGLIELTPEFLQYLQTSEGQQTFPTINESFKNYQDYTQKFFNRVWNNYLRNRPLYQVIGGEGSGSGRVGFGLAVVGGEGSGSGRRRLEDLSTNSLALEKGGELVVSVMMDHHHFHGLNYTQNIVQRLFNVNKEYMPYLNGGALIPSHIVNVDCRR